MDLPTSREIELETLLRQRDAQVQDLTDEVTHLRQYLNNQPSPSTADPISLPPSLVSLLLPHIKDSSSTATGTASNTITSALSQRVKLLQEENDELYEILKTGETGRLKEDVRSLRRVVQKLEGALRESHQVISNLQEELEKSHATLLANSRSNNFASSPRTHSQSPALRPNNQLPPYPNTSFNGSSKQLPTGPRAHKKPRLSEAPTSVPPHMKGNRSQSGSGRRNDSRERSPRASVDRKVPRLKTEVDDDQRVHPRTPPERPPPPRENERERERDRNADHDRDPGRDRDRTKGREREKEREHNRDRERDRPAKRNGAYGGPSSGGGGAAGGGGRRGHRSSNASSYASGDRTLAERMGL